MANPVDLKSILDELKSQVENGNTALPSVLASVPENAIEVNVKTPDETGIVLASSKGTP